VNKWLALVQQLWAGGNSVGLLGASPLVQNAFWKGGSAEEELLANSALIDLRGWLTLPEVAGAIARAKLVVTLDNGIMHLAATTSTPTVALFRHGIHRLWCPPSESVRAVVAMPNQTVAEISLEAVWKAIADASPVG
jgi:ADP-heptose:LPS heptosyltransferase